jgi:hypothetical protein
MGTATEPSRCPQCGGYNVQKLRRSIGYKGTAPDTWECLTCAHSWELAPPRKPRPVEPKGE